MSQTVPPAPADRLALIIEGLCQSVARNGGLKGLAGPFLILVWSRLRRIAARFARAATTPPAPSRLATKRPARPQPAAPRQSRQPPLPRRKAWLLRLVPETASGASQLRHFLADPEVASVLAADPRLRRTLRPLCHMLGIRPATALPPPDAPLSARPTASHAPPPALPGAIPPLPPPRQTPGAAPPPLPFQQRDALPEPLATSPALA